MTVVAGIDVGNSTTEVVLLRLGDRAPEVVASARAMTRGTKGSRESLVAAARLVGRTAAREGVQVAAARVAPLRPVHTTCRSVRESAVDTGPLRLVARSATTAAGDGAGVGRPVPLRALRDRLDGPVVPLVDADVTFTEAASRINSALRRGGDVVAVLVERDEAVLIANRLDATLPVVDQVPVADLTTCPLVAVEARPYGQPLKHADDPYWLAHHFGTKPGEPAVEAMARELEDASLAVVALEPYGRPSDQHVQERVDEIIWKDGTREALVAALPKVRATGPGYVAAVDWVDGEELPADDVYAVHLAAIARNSHMRRGTLRADGIVTALLQVGGSSADDPAGTLTEALEIPVSSAPSEAAAGRAGALSTPGAPADVIVVDLGGGTVDVSDREHRCIVAGAGEMLTIVTAQALGVPAGTAEYVKRGPALHLNAPQIVVTEKGGRSFLNAPAPGSAVGALCAQGPVGLAPFNRNLGLGEWRAWRTTAKAETIGQNVARALAALGSERPSALILVGGAAGDDEAVAAVADRLPSGTSIGRANVAGSLGHRFAVAYGLARGGVAI